MFKKNKKIILLVLTLLVFVTSYLYYESKVEKNQEAEKTKEIQGFQNS
jgi:hypothetical protein